MTCRPCVKGLHSECMGVDGLFCDCTDQSHDFAKKLEGLCPAIVVVGDAPSWPSSGFTMPCGKPQPCADHPAPAPTETPAVPREDRKGRCAGLIDGVGGIYKCNVPLPCSLHPAAPAGPVQPTCDESRVTPFDLRVLVARLRAENVALAKRVFDLGKELNEGDAILALQSENVALRNKLTALVEHFDGLRDFVCPDGGAEAIAEARKLLNKETK